MSARFKALGGLGMALLAALSLRAAPSLPEVVATAARRAQETFRAQQLKADQFALTVVDLRDPAAPQTASYRGDALIYPASVVKLFYLAAAERWLEDGRLPDTPELQRALRDMIVDSSNDATSYVVDLLTGTTSGPELPDGELKAWIEKRNVVNRYFAGLGYAGINVNQKPWGDGPYGRETQARTHEDPNRNLLTTNAIARLLTEIATGKCVTAARSAAMMQLLSRDPAAPSSDPDNQAHFIGAALPPGAKLWSKAGWTSQTRHDAAYVELPNGERRVIVIFTTDHAAQTEIVPTIARFVVEAAATPLK